MNLYKQVKQPIIKKKETQKYHFSYGDVKSSKLSNKWTSIVQTLLSVE